VNDGSEVEFRTRLLTGRPLPLAEFLPLLKRWLPELATLASTPDVAREGRCAESVLDHTQQVLDQVQPWLGELPGEQAQALYLAALLHEVGRGAPGLGRVVAQARDLLFRLGLPGPLRDHVVYLVRLHSLPARWGRPASLGRLWRLAWTLNTRLLYLLAQADNQARGLGAAERRVQAAEAFRRRCEELAIWGQEPPPLIPPWRWQALAPADPWLRRRTAGELRFWRVKGVLSTPEQGEAWLAGQRPAPAGTLYLTVGVPGSGKSTWIARHLAQARLISMDLLRERLLGRRGDQSRNAEVYRLSRRELGRALRARETVVWDAQSHTWQARQGLLAVARESHAYVIVIYFDVPLALALERNTWRRDVVPPEVIVRNYGDLEEPRPFEAEELWRVDANGKCARYVGDEGAGSGEWL